MLSIATLHAVDYYTDAASEAFGYYGGQQGSGEVDPPGHWTGALARQYFGTDATVRREDFAALFFGIDPQSGRSLTKSADPLGFACWQAERIAADPARTADERRAARQQAGELRGQIKARESKDGWRGHRAGIDLTFSAPKDFSLLVAAADPDERHRLLAAWRRSVEATLTDAEQRYAKTRLRDPAGRLTKEHIAGAAIAMFEHIAARPVGDQPPDPDAHLHCVMFSPVLCHDAATRALFSNDLRLNLKVLDAEARARLAQELAGMGYAVTEDRQKHCMSFHLPGISEAERIRYSKRRGEIVAGINAGQFQSSAVAAIGTRQGKGDWSRADALAAWREDFAAHGLTLERIRQAPPPDERQHRSDAEILADLLAMQSYFSARDLRQALWEEAQFIPAGGLPAGMDIGHWIDARANQLLQSPDLLEAQLPDGSTASRLRSATGDEEPIFTTRSLLRREIALDAAVNALGQTQLHAVGWAEASRIVAAQERRKTAEAQAKATAAGQPLPEDFRWAYRDDQKAAIAQVLAGPDVGFIQAYAGTGKTTAAAAMIEVWRAKGKKVIALAPSNKAAGQLTEDCQLTGENVALTVDAFLRSKAKDGVDADTVLFVDEASMLGFDNAEALVNLACERGAKIVFQGDKEQLPSVARGRFFANCIEQRLGTEAAELTVITRQREAWARAATNAAARGDFATTMGLLDQHDLIHTEGTDEAVLDRIARDHLADPRPVDQKLIVASRNADVAALNARIRQALVDGGLISGGVPCLAGKERRQPMLIGVGDRLIFTDTLKDGRRKLAVNGAIGTVQAVEATDGGVQVRVLLDGQRDPVVFDTRDFTAFQHAYAISIHKSQGATVESCRYLFSEFVSSELAYVGMSRHRSTFGLYCRTDQKAGLAGWMGKRIEKLDARDLVSVAELNAAAARLRGQDAVRANAARRHVLDRLSQGVRRVVEAVKAQVAERLPSLPALPAISTTGLDALRRHRQRLAGHVARLRLSVMPAVPRVPWMPSVAPSAPAPVSLIDKLRQRRQPTGQKGGPAQRLS